MLTTTQLICSAISITLANSAFSSEAWPQEPLAVFGIPLAAEYDSLNLLICPEAATSKQVCIHPAYQQRKVFFKLGGLPDIGFAYGASVMTWNDKVSAILIETPRANWHTLRQVLIERYGPPMISSVINLEISPGRIAHAEMLDWKGPHTTIIASERGSPNMNGAYAIISDVASAAEKRDEQRRKAKDAAAKF